MRLLMGLERSKRVGGKMHIEAKGRQYVRFARSVRAVQARHLEQTPPQRCARKADEVDVTTMCVVCRNGIHCLKTDGLLVFIIENVFAMENATIINVLRSGLNRRGRKATRVSCRANCQAKRVRLRWCPRRRKRV